MPTFYGPTNIPPIEAVYSNCPVLVSDIYGMRNQMEDYAIYFNPLDVTSISNAMITLLTNKEPIAKETILRLKNKFSLERFTNTVDKILNQVTYK